MSYRTDIAAAIKTQLEGQTAAADDKIFTSLDRPLGPDDMPSIVIYTMASRRGENSHGESHIPRLVTVAIEAAVLSNPASAMSDAEAFADEIETAMDADRTIGNLVQDCQWQETVTDVDGEGEITIGVVLLQYQVQIATNQKPDSVFEFLADGMEDAPLPGEVYINPQPVPDAYDTNELTDDIAQVIAEPIAPVDGACEDGSCDIGAYQGDQDKWPPDAALPEPEPEPEPTP